MGLANQRFSKGEELANAISHLVGAVMGIIALVVMTVYSVKHGSVLHISSSIVFGISLFILYLSSTFNHWLPTGKVKEFFFTFDQIAIYLLIAGSYTPFTLIALNGTIGWTMFGIEWGLALIGIILKLSIKSEFKNGVSHFYIISYVAMGWIIFLAIPALIEAISLTGFLWIAAGGIFYSVGIIFYKMERLKFNHLIWHLFVLAGSIAHFIAIYGFVLKVQIT
ncbi:MAG: hemolysin III family protein [Bacteroidales bacterium]|nr:hemolysin III family protein [Bacteroidales bacterium]